MMKEDNVREKLKGLYTELKNTRSNDPQTQDRLRTLTADVKNALDNIDDLRPDQHKNVLDRLQGAVENFETSHPELTSVLNDVISSLANWGI
jgi:tRNA C32,U32 (ribose-2'-O)-methylase TrmJ